MKYNGFWSKGEKRLVVIRTTKEGQILFREVDKDGKKISKLHKKYADDVLPSFIKEGSGEMYKPVYV